jgi:hypothetical protein
MFARRSRTATKGPKLLALISLASILAACGGGGGGGSNAPAISVAFVSEPPSSMAISGTASVAATVGNDPAARGVTWSVKCQSSQCGSFSVASTASGVATTYTAPATVPNPATVTLMATSVSNGTVSAASTLTITAAPPPPSPELADGSYVYHFSGQDPTGSYYVVGAFTVQGGVITAGEQDFTDEAIVATDTLNPANCLIASAGGNLEIRLDTGDKSVGVNGIEILHGAKVSGKRVLISEFDSFASGTGAIDSQTSVAAPMGGYAFYTLGIDQSGAELAIGGVLNIAGTSVTTSGSVFDINDGGTFILQQQQFASGSVTAPDAFGRVTFSLAPSVPTVPAFILTGYIVGNQIQLIESQNDNLSGVTGGTALSQGTNTGNFSMSSPSVTGVSYAFGAAGATVNGSAYLAGGLGLNAGGTVSGAMAINDLINSYGFSITGGNYTVDVTGRVTVTNVTSDKFSGTIAFQLYLDGNGNALELGIDPSQVTAAMAYAQTAASADYEGTFAVAAQGFWTYSASAYPGWAAVGVATIGSGQLLGFTDYTQQNGDGSFTPTGNVALSGSEDSVVGTFTLYGLNAGSFQAKSGYGYYPIDSNRVIAVQIDGVATGQQGVLMLEAVQSN